tara:strand:- start:257 stop:394 length:138 start_codon:yes stop_codon:yes gene_type:complete
MKEKQYKLTEKGKEILKDKQLEEIAINMEELAKSILGFKKDNDEG